MPGCNRALCPATNLGMEITGSIESLTDASHQSREDLLRRWLDGCRGILYRVLMVYADSAAEREDLEQEIALALWRSTRGFEGNSADSTWVYRVALNTALTHRRKASRRPPTTNCSRNPRLPIRTAMSRRGSTPRSAPCLRWIVRSSSCGWKARTTRIWPGF
ncbi:MAG: hypothetical protein CMQ24_09525 [Gammaproteobacteria bacterium]|nr:hypothetical protein [Gammaproteobacteria bacterium]